MATTLADPGSATSSNPPGPKLSEESDFNSKPPVCGDSISDGETATGAADVASAAVSTKERQMAFIRVGGWSSPHGTGLAGEMSRSKIWGVI
jgi:hypothetical protein